MTDITHYSDQELRIIEIDEHIENLEYAIDYGYEDDYGQIVELLLEKEKLISKL